MPGITLHVLAGQRVLSWWRSQGGAPFDLDEPGTVNAFLHGAVGPDFGYLPGGYRPLSELAHGRRTGALVRDLIWNARTPQEYAFAWGWLSHLLADLEIHPWIGRGVGALLTGRRDHFLSGASHPLEHLRVEMGLDAWLADRHPKVTTLRLRPVFDGSTAAFLRDAYTRVYRLRLEIEPFLRSHRAAGRRVGQALASIGIVRALTEGGSKRAPVAAARWALRAAHERIGGGGVALAYLTPVAPDAWLLGEVLRCLEEHAALFMHHYRLRARTLGDHDLDTGLPLPGDSRSWSTPARAIRVTSPVDSGAREPIDRPAGVAGVAGVAGRDGGRSRPLAAVSGG